MSVLETIIALFKIVGKKFKITKKIQHPEIALITGKL